MALTLLEASKHARTPEELAVVRELAEGDLLSVLPFRNISGSGLFWKREESLANIGFRHINQGLEQDYGQTSQQSEALKFFGGDVVVDRAILELEGPEARAYQVQSKVRALRMAYERVFVKGSETASNGLEFDGIEKRCGAPGETSQSFDNGGGGLELAKLDEMLDAVDAQGGTKYLVMSKAMRRRLTQAARDGVINGGINIMQDEMGRKQSFYQETPIMIIDRDENNVEIDMTLTAPGCPVAGEMPGWVADAVEPIAGVKTVNVQLVWDPPWGMDMLSDEAKLELGFM